jgi:hypothetical protein
MNNNDNFLEEEIFLNSETGEWESRIVDVREKKEVVKQQKELSKQIDNNFFFPYREDTLENKRIKKSLISEFEYDDVSGLEHLSKVDKKLYNDFKKRKELSIAQKGCKRNGGRLPIVILEKDIKYSIENSNTIREAASFLHVSRQRWTKYAKMYIDTDTGLTLYQKHLKKCWGTIDFVEDRNKGLFIGEGFFKRNKELYNKLYQRLIDPVTGEYILKDQRNFKTKRNRKIRLYDVLQGLHPLYDPVKLKRNLLRTGWFEKKCSCCGYSNTRSTDDNCALVLNFKDGNSQNHIRDNLEMLCFNCFFNNSSLWKNKKYYSY